MLKKLNIQFFILHPFSFFFLVINLNVAFEHIKEKCLIIYLINVQICLIFISKKICTYIYKYFFHETLFYEKRRLD